MNYNKYIIKENSKGSGIGAKNKIEAIDFIDTRLIIIPINY